LHNYLHEEFKLLVDPFQKKYSFFSYWIFLDLLLSDYAATKSHTLIPIFGSMKKYLEGDGVRK